jgi:hypothetical protein
VRKLAKTDVISYANHEDQHGKKFPSISVEILTLSSVFNYMRKNYGLGFSNPAEDYPYTSSEK